MSYQEENDTLRSALADITQQHDALAAAAAAAGGSGSGSGGGGGGGGGGGTD